MGNVVNGVMDDDIDSSTKNALLVGATGLIGGELLQRLIASQQYQHIVVLVRNPTAIDALFPEARPDTVVCCTFEQGIPEHLQIDDFYCALGTTQKKSGKEGLRQVDKTLVVDCAQQAQQAGATTASIVSAVGASARSPVYYSRIKGEMEQAVEALCFNTTIFWQPSILIGQRNEYRLGEEIAAKLMSFAWLGNYQALTGKQVAQAIATVTPNAQTGLYRYLATQIKSSSK